MSRLLYRLINSARDYFTPYMYVTTLGFTNDKKEIERMVANAMLHNYLPVVFTVIEKGNPNTIHWINPGHKLFDFSYCHEGWRLFFFNPCSCVLYDDGT